MPGWVSDGYKWRAKWDANQTNAELWKQQQWIVSQVQPIADVAQAYRQFAEAVYSIMAEGDRYVENDLATWLGGGAGAYKQHWGETYTGNYGLATAGMSQGARRLYAQNEGSPAALKALQQASLDAAATVDDVRDAVGAYIFCRWISGVIDRISDVAMVAMFIIPVFGEIGGLIFRALIEGGIQAAKQTAFQLIKDGLDSIVKNIIKVELKNIILNGLKDGAVAASITAFTDGLKRGDWYLNYEVPTGLPSPYHFNITEVIESGVTAGAGSVITQLAEPALTPLLNRWSPTQRPILYQAFGHLFGGAVNLGLNAALQDVNINRFGQPWDWQEFWKSGLFGLGMGFHGHPPDLYVFHEPGFGDLTLVRDGNSFHLVDPVSLKPMGIGEFTTNAAGDNVFHVTVNDHNPATLPDGTRTHDIDLAPAGDRDPVTMEHITTHWDKMPVPNPRTGGVMGIKFLGETRILSTFGPRGDAVQIGRVEIASDGRFSATGPTGNTRFGFNNTPGDYHIDPTTGAIVHLQQAAGSFPDASITLPKGSSAVFDRTNRLIEATTPEGVTIQRGPDGQLHTEYPHNTVKGTITDSAEPSTTAFNGEAPADPQTSPTTPPHLTSDQTVPAGPATKTQPAMPETQPAEPEPQPGTIPTEPAAQPTEPGAPNAAAQPGGAPRTPQKPPTTPGQIRPAAAGTNQTPTSRENTFDNITRRSAQEPSEPPPTSKQRPQPEPTPATEQTETPLEQKPPIIAPKTKQEEPVKTPPEASVNPTGQTRRPEPATTTPKPETPGQTNEQTAPDQPVKHADPIPGVAANAPGDVVAFRQASSLADETPTQNTAPAGRVWTPPIVPIEDTRPGTPQAVTSQPGGHTGVAGVDRQPPASDAAAGSASDGLKMVARVLEEWPADGTALAPEQEGAVRRYVDALQREAAMFRRYRETPGLGRQVADTVDRMAGVLERLLAGVTPRGRGASSARAHAVGAGDRLPEEARHWILGELGEGAPRVVAYVPIEAGDEPALSVEEGFRLRHFLCWATRLTGRSFGYWLLRDYGARRWYLAVVDGGDPKAGGSGSTWVSSQYVTDEAQYEAARSVSGRVREAPADSPFGAADVLLADSAAGRRPKDVVVTYGQDGDTRVREISRLRIPKLREPVRAALARLGELQERVRRLNTALGAVDAALLDTAEPRIVAVSERRAVFAETRCVWPGGGPAGEGRQESAGRAVRIALDRAWRGEAAEAERRMLEGFRTYLTETRNAVRRDGDSLRMLLDRYFPSLNVRRETELRNQRVLNEGRALVGSFRWRGGSGTDPADGWRIKERTKWKNVNDFARWIRNKGSAPGAEGVMNCTQAVLYILYRAGAVDAATLRELHREAAEDARAAYVRERDTDAASAAYVRKIYDFLAPGPRTAFTIDPVTGIGGPDIPAGHLVFIPETHHTMISLGTRGPDGHQEVLSHWRYPQPGGDPYEHLTGFLQKTSVEDVVSSEGAASRREKAVHIESAVSAWLLETDGVVGSSSPNGAPPPQS